VEQHHRIVRREIKRAGGRELDTAGDGFFASFKEPASAIACACAASDEVRELGIEIRSGVHFGECERSGKKLAGITVVIGSRISALGGAGDVLVSDTAAQLARGAGFGFEDHGTHTLKGVDDDWRVMAVTSVDGAPRSAALEPDEARDRRERIAIEGRAGLSRRWVAAIAAAAVIGGFALGVALFGGSEPIVPGPRTVARIGASGDGFDRAFAIGPGAEPVDLAFGSGKLWVANATTNTIMGIEPESGEAQVFGAPSTPTGVAFADGRVWVTYGFSSDAAQRVGVLDLTRGILGPAPVDVPDGSYPIAGASEGLWIADPLGSTVTRYDPARQETDSGALGEGSGPVDLELDGSTLWVASGREPAVFHLPADALASEPERFGTGGVVPTALALARDGTLWVASEIGDAVLALDATGVVRVNVVLGARCNGPVDLAAGRGSIWVSCSLSETVLRLRPDGSVSGAIAVVGRPGAIAVDGGGSVWVAVQGV
jgi:streptogramin lyase